MATLVLPRRLRGFVIPAGLVAAWAVAGATGLANPHVVVPLGTIVEAAGRVIADGTLATAAATTLYRMLGGLALGTTAGLAAGLALGLSTTAERIVAPTFHALRQIAVFAWMPLLTAWLGSGGTAMTALIAVAAFFPVVMNTESACRSVPLPYREIGRVLEFPPAMTIRRIVLPAAAPGIFAGLELALVSAWFSTIGAEYLIAAGDGLGVLLASARTDGDMARVIVGILTLGLVGFVLNRLLNTVSRRTLRWRSPNP